MKEHVSFRMTQEDIARVNALAPAFKTSWHNASRSEILRALVLEALAAREKGGGP